MVSKAKVKDFCEDENIQLIEASAATGSNVEEAFMKLARAIRKKFDPKDSKSQRSGMFFLTYKTALRCLV